MYFRSFAEFIEMGGHGFYVWLSYFLVIFPLLAYFIYSNKLARHKKQELVKFFRRMDERHQSNESNKAN